MSKAQTGMYCTGFSKRQPTIDQAEVSYDSTAGCVNRHNLLHVCKTWTLRFYVFFSLSESSQDRQARDARDEKGLKLFGET